jgi:hypothetical protein
VESESLAPGRCGSPRRAGAAEREKGAVASSGSARRTGTGVPRAVPRGPGG